MAQAEKNARGSLLNPLPLTITNNKYEEKILTEIYFFIKYYTKNTDGLISQKEMTIFEKMTPFENKSGNAIVEYVSTSFREIWAKTPFETSNL